MPFPKGPVAFAIHPHVLYIETNGYDAATLHGPLFHYPFSHLAYWNEEMFLEINVHFIFH